MNLVPLRLRSALALGAVFAVGVVAFGWPFFTTPGSALDTSHSGDAPMVFVLMLPLLAAVVHWQDGAAQQVSEDDGDADTTIKVAWSDWEQMAAGQIDGMTAFMTGKLKIEGDMSNAMQLQGVLAKLRG